MRETIEYARSGFFTDRLWQFNQGGRWKMGARVKLVVSTSKRTRQDAVYPEESPGERRRPLECALHLSRWDPAPVFSFRFRATERKKVRDGVLVGRDGTAGEKKNARRDRGGANGIGEFVEPPARCRRRGTSDARAK